MGQPVKSTIKVKYTESDVYTHRGEVCVTFYVDAEKKKVIAQLHDDNLTNFVTSVINAKLVRDKQINGFLGSFDLVNHKLQVSVTSIEGGVFDEKEGKQRALAKLLLKRDTCISNLVCLIADNAGKSFFDTKDKLLGKLDAISYFVEYADARDNNIKSREK